MESRGGESSVFAIKTRYYTTLNVGERLFGNCPPIEFGMVSLQNADELAAFIMPRTTPNPCVEWRLAINVSTQTSWEIPLSRLSTR
jgi:hypothetical protein